MRKDANRCGGTGLRFASYFGHAPSNASVFVIYCSAGRRLGTGWGNYINTRELCKAAKSLSDIAKLLDQEPILRKIKVVYRVRAPWSICAYALSLASFSLAVDVRLRKLGRAR